ncbi:hypothetical protein CASFOL_014323 [Castilleja foliolosa]|uniref:DUF676 domain-containing protein n=1 Tax=Castilleja foliolosa TaxID=1961234 RepID=A0ABD3DMJ9_9LAMI
MINDDAKPDHLLVLVHGIMGSPSDWTYCEAELKRRLGKRFLIYASSCNTYTKTFTGIDGAGKRLADEVMQVVKKTKSLQKISFLAHSLGGLIARYAIAVLYTQNVDSENSCDSDNGLIAGLEAINFITLARNFRSFSECRFWRKSPLHLPLFLLVKRAVNSFLQMVGPINLLCYYEWPRIVKMGNLYLHLVLSNIGYYMVGWRTSSIRRESELVKPFDQSLDGYEHIVNIEYCPPVLSETPDFPPEAARAKEAAQNKPNTQNTREYHEIMEDEMIDGLQRLGWTKVDVSFHSTFWPFMAHHNIQVKNEWFNNAGAGVVAHVADSIIEQEKKEGLSPYIGAGL